MTKRPYSPTSLLQIQNNRNNAGRATGTIKQETMSAIDSFTKTLSKNKSNRFMGKNLDQFLAYNQKHGQVYQPGAAHGAQTQQNNTEPTQE